ncbi:hypothetical protein BDC45DRAFT_278367 [Circinella umbellata]|nr:hypothetical protein BDC45DRAFT_278367 [Circinella umbellata]
MVSMSSVKSIRGDRSMGVLTLALMIAVIVYNTLKGGAFPWLNGHYDDGKPSSFNSGFATYCSNYKNEWSKYRCWLTDGTWLGCLIVAAFWLFLVIFVYAQKSSDIYDDDYDVYDFKEDVPMAVTSNKNESAYHASSPTSNPPQQQQPSANYYNNGNQANYQEYDSYYDYPPQSPYAGYKQPAAAGPGGYPYPGNGTGYAQDDTVHMLSDAGQPQYYSPHLNTGNAAAATPPAPSSPHVKAQTPNAY